MAVFGLLHGAFEGAWCWEDLIPQLEALGHRAVAVDLPIDDVSAGWDDYVDVAMGAFDDPGTIVVAHSRAGRMVPLLLARGRYRTVVLLSAAIPGGLLPPPYRAAPRPVPGGATRLPQCKDETGRTLLTREVAAAIFSDCTQEQLEGALARARPQHELESPADVLWPTVAVSYIYGIGDPVVDPDWVEQACRERLGVEPVAMPGGHSLFMSRPRELAAQLHLTAPTSLPASESPSPAAEQGA